MDQQQPDKDKAEPQEESWDHANFTADFTPHTSRRLDLYYPYLSPQWNNGPNSERLADDDDTNYHINIQSVDTSNMTLLDVCNYMPEPSVDGSGHCVWMGAIYLSHALSIGLAMAEMNDEGQAKVKQESFWYNNDYLTQKVVAEFGCGTGAAGIALLKLLSLKPTTTTGAATPQQFQFWDNDPEALELCRQNCQQNLQPPGTPAEIPCMYQLDSGWVLDSEVTQQSSDNATGQVDTVLATDCLYDLKIIRPFLETATRLLSSSTKIDKHGGEDVGGSIAPTNNTPKKHLMLSHVPRWFLPRNNDTKNSNSNGTAGNATHERAEDLENHIVQEASECGLSLLHTVRPKDVLAQLQALLSADDNDVEPKNPIRVSDEAKETLLEDLEEMDRAGAVLWVFVLANSNESVRE